MQNRTHHSKRRNDNRNKHSDDIFDLPYFVVDFDGYVIKPDLIHKMGIKITCVE